MSLIAKDPNRIPRHLIDGLPPDARMIWKMDLLWHMFGRPITEKFPDTLWTEGYRPPARHDRMRTDPAYANKVAKNMGQHPFCEALDGDHPDREMLISIFRWAHIHLPWYQLLIYFRVPRHPQGLGESFHISMLGEFRDIKRKAIYQVARPDPGRPGKWKGVWYRYDGTFQHLPRVA